MSPSDKINILLVDDQPAKLLSYEAILKDLGENLLIAESAQTAFEYLLKTDVAVILVDVFMPEFDGFELARMIREHPRFQQTAIIFISGVLLTDLDFLKGYRLGAVDYVSVPVVPEILRAKVRVFAELYRKTKQLEGFNRELEERVRERTAALEASTAELRASEGRLRLAFEAARMGWWEYDIRGDRVSWSASLVDMMGFAPDRFGGTFEGLSAHVHPEDRERLRDAIAGAGPGEGAQGCEIRFIRTDGSVRWSLLAGQVARDAAGQPLRFAGIDLDITPRKLAEERQHILMRELDHRAKNLLAVVQSVVRLSQAGDMVELVDAVDGRIQALARAHTLLSENRWEGVSLNRIVEDEVAPFADGESRQILTEGPSVTLNPAAGQSLALAIHELITNAAKYGALSAPDGRVGLRWEETPRALTLEWTETGGPAVTQPSRAGFGMKVIVASIEGQLHGRAAFDWAPTGLRCRFVLPRRDLGTAAQQPAPDHARHMAPALPIPVVGSRILLVEDEAIVGVMTKEMLTDLGFAVTGPIADLEDAAAAVREGAWSCAILDVNLGGKPVYPVAEMLAARGVPFVFLTGYNTDAVDARFADAPVLEKPVAPAALRGIFTIMPAPVATARPTTAAAAS